MPKTVIGQDIIAKQQEATPTTMVGISRQPNNKFSVIVVKVHGMEVLSREIRKEDIEFTEAIYTYQIVSADLVNKKLRETLK